MKKQKTLESLMYFSTTPKTVSQFLSYVSNVSNLLSKKLFNISEATDLMKALRSPLSDASAIRLNPELANACYRYLSVASRLPVSGYSSFICPLDGSLSRLFSLKASLELEAQAYATMLREETIKPDAHIPDSVSRYCESMATLIDDTTIRFTVNEEELLKIFDEQHSDAFSELTVRDVRDFIGDTVSVNYDAPATLIYTYVYALLYLYRISLLD